MPRGGFNLERALRGGYIPEEKEGFAEAGDIVKER